MASKLHVAMTEAKAKADTAAALEELKALPDLVRELAEEVRSLRALIEGEKSPMRAAFERESARAKGGAK
jgi:2-oxo-4-hydroxy-4-carboxy--5-ureidoimidazoline (OHCU) decarboxylase